MFGERGRCDLPPLLSLLLGFLGVPLAHLLRRMVTVQDPEKSWLAKEPACRLVVNVLLGLLLPPSGPSGSGCLSLEGDGLQPANSLPSFVLCMVLAVSYVRAFCVVAIPTVWFASPRHVLSQAGENGHQIAKEIQCGDQRPDCFHRHFQFLLCSILYFRELHFSGSLSPGF